jgi:hypothetical protein
MAFSWKAIALKLFDERYANYPELVLSRCCFVATAEKR